MGVCPDQVGAAVFTPSVNNSGTVVAPTNLNFSRTIWFDSKAHAGWVPNQLTTVERDALTVVTNGTWIHNLTDGKIQFRQGNAWIDLVGGTGIGPVAANMTALAALNPITNGVVTLLGYNGPFDGGGGTFYGTNSVAGTNLGTRIVTPFAWSWQRLHDGNEINVAWFGVRGNGSNETTLVKAAYDALDKTKPPWLVFPPAGRYVYSLTITNNGIRIRGPGGVKDYTTNVVSYFSPPNATSPVIQVGDGTNFARGFVIESATFYGGITGTNGHVGINLAGGAFEGVLRDVVLLNFHTNILAMATGTLPCSKITLDNVAMQPLTTQANARGLYVKMPDNQSPFTTAINWVSGSINGPVSAGSYAIEADGTDLYFGESFYMDAAAGKAIYLNKSGAGQLEPHIISSGFNLDVGGNNVGVTLYNNSDPYDRIIGPVYTTAKLQTLDGTTYDIARNNLVAGDRINNAIVQNNLYWSRGGTFTNTGQTFLYNDASDGFNIQSGDYVWLRPILGRHVVIRPGNLLLDNNQGIQIAETNGSFAGTLYNDTNNTVTLAGPNNVLVASRSITNSINLDAGADGSDLLVQDGLSTFNSNVRITGGLNIGLGPTNQGIWWNAFSEENSIVSYYSELGAGWIARATSAQLLQNFNGFVFYTDTGLTPGVAFVPTTRATINNTGLTVVGTAAADTLAATTTLTLGGKNLWALVPGANVTFSTNVGANELTINSSGSGGGGSGSGSLQNATAIGGGTNYPITTNFALVDFGSGDPSLTLPAAGRYLLVATFSGESANTFQKDFAFRDTTAGVYASTNNIATMVGSGFWSVAIHSVYESPGANTIQLWSRMNDPSYTGTHEVWATNTTFTYVRLDGVLGFNVNAASVSTPNFQNTAATGTVPASTVGVTGTNFGVTIGQASATEAGVVTTGAQSYDGTKTFLDTINVTNAVNANSLKVTNTVDIDGIAAIGAISDVESEINGKALSGHTHSFANLTTGTNAALMAGNFKNTISEKSDIETISGATPTVNWQTQPIKTLVVTTNITFSDVNRPTAAAVGEQIAIFMTNSVATPAAISVPSGWRDETGIGFTNLVAGQTATITAWWTGTEVRYYWRTFEYPYDTVLTGAFTLATTDHGKLFNNLGASSLTTYTLPAADSGLSFEFAVADTDGIKVLASGDDTIRIAGSVTAAAGSITNSVIGGTLKLKAINATNYYGVWSQGTWLF